MCKVGVANPFCCSYGFSSRFCCCLFQILLYFAPFVSVCVLMEPLTPFEVSSEYFKIINSLIAKSLSPCLTSEASESF